MSKTTSSPNSDEVGFSLNPPDVQFYLSVCVRYCDHHVGGHCALFDTTGDSGWSYYPNTGEWRIRPACPYYNKHAQREKLDQI